MILCDPNFSVSQCFEPKIMRYLCLYMVKKMDSQSSSAFKLILLPTHCCYGLDITLNSCIVITAFYTLYLPHFSHFSTPKLNLCRLQNHLLLVIKFHREMRRAQVAIAVPVSIQNQAMKSYRVCIPHLIQILEEGHVNVSWRI